MEALAATSDVQRLQDISGTGGLASIAGDIKDNAELEMMQLQDLVAKRQTAVQLVTNMMSKMDDTALSVAKNV